MTTTILKSELTKAIAGINDKSLLEALYTIINRAEQPGIHEYELDDDELRVIESRKRDYKAGKIKGLTVGEVRKKVMKKLSA